MRILDVRKVRIGINHFDFTAKVLQHRGDCLPWRQAEKGTFSIGASNIVSPNWNRAPPAKITTVKSQKYFEN